jgi:hypothetical protein
VGRFRIHGKKQRLQDWVKHKGIVVSFPLKVTGAYGIIIPNDEVNMRVLLLSLILSFSALAQHSSQPEKESSSDLRTGLVMFSIHNLEKDMMLWLERTSNDDFFLKKKEKGEEKMTKISGRDAKKLDQEFAAKFLKAMYELPASPEGCKAMLQLSMKGEAQDICGKDDKKTQEFLPFSQDLSKRF